MKVLLSVLAFLFVASPVFADVKIEIKSVELKETKSNGKKWDVKVPLMKRAVLPDIFVEVKQGANSLLKTPVTKNSLTATYTGQSVTVADPTDVTITVWDKDLKRSDAAGTVTITDQTGDVTLSGGGVRALKLSITGNQDKAAPVAPAAAPAKDAAAEKAAADKAAAEPAKAEPAKAEPAKAEPAKAEPAPAQ